MFECVVLDFDGTFTLVDEEAVPFLGGYREGLSAYLNRNIDEDWHRTETEIRANFNRYGWEYEGQIVAPSHADPYIMAASIGQVLLSRETNLDAKGRSELLNGLYQTNYAQATTVFRPDAEHVVQELLKTNVPVFVVTNSKTEHVREKIRTLNPSFLEHLEIRGDAKKYVISQPSAADERFARIPAELRVDGLERSILMHRGLYFDALKRIWSETGAQPDSTLVCGDIFELDLALPSALGARIHMVGRPDTPEYERQAVAASQGVLTEDLASVLQHLT